MPKVDSWDEYEKLLKNAPRDFQRLVRDTYDHLYAARVVAFDVLGPEASEDAVLRVFESLARREPSEE